MALGAPKHSANWVLFVLIKKKKKAMGDPLLHKSVRPLPYSCPLATFPYLKARGVANFPCLPSQVFLATQQISTCLLPLQPQEEFLKYLQLHHKKQRNSATGQQEELKKYQLQQEWNTHQDSLMSGTLLDSPQSRLCTSRGAVGRSEASRSLNNIQDQKSLHRAFFIKKNIALSRSSFL